MWLSLYISCLIFGGVFVGLSVMSGLGGEADADFDKELDFDPDADVDADFDFDKELELDFDKEFEFDKELDLDFDHDADIDHDGAMVHHADGEKDLELHGRRKKYRPYLSFRFYTFLTAFFGLTGTGLSLLGAGAIITFLLSLSMGLAAGLGLTYFLHVADRSEGGRVTTDRDLMGTTAKVTIPIRPGQVGKVKLRIKGQVVEMMAKQYESESDDQVVFDFEEECMVLGIDDGVVQVMNRDQLERRRNRN